MYNKECCEEERKESEWVKIIDRKLSDIFWKIRDCVDGVEKQEELCLSFLKYIGAKETMDDVIVCLLDLEKKLQIKRYMDKKESEDELEQWEEDLYIMFEDVWNKEESEKE